MEISTDMITILYTKRLQREDKVTTCVITKMMLRNRNKSTIYYELFINMLF